VVSDRNSLADLFFAQAERFAAVHPRINGVTLRIVASHYLRSPEYRDLAWYDPDSHAVYLLDRLRYLPQDNQLGVIWHELGHAADENISSKGAERRADSISEGVTGRPLLYDLRGVQSAARGVCERSEIFD